MSLGIETLSLTVDNEASVRSFRDELTALLAKSSNLPKLDYLVNNAGRNYTVPALDLDLAEVRATFETNVVAVMHIIQVLAPLLIAAKGTIVQISSLAVVVPYVFGSAYGASKAALTTYSNTLRVELEPFGVKVVSVMAGGVTSNLARTARTLPEGSLYAPIANEYKRRQTYALEGAMENEEFAKRVVGRLESSGWWPFGGVPRWIWDGHRSTLVWLLSGGWAWSGVFDAVMKKTFNLWKLEKKDKQA